MATTNWTIIKREKKTNQIEIYNLDKKWTYKTAIGIATELNNSEIYDLVCIIETNKIMIKNDKEEEKKRPIYSIGEKKFNTFKAMKSFVWYNNHTDEEIQGYEMIDDEIQKHYIFIKKERRLLCNVIYDKTKVYEEWCKHLQLELFKDG